MIFPELVDNCQLKCSLCWNRNRKPSGEQMTLKTIERVLQVFGRQERYEWFNWGEPLLYENFHEFTNLVKGTRSSISTNLSLEISDFRFHDMTKLLGVIVSMSGMTEDVYHMYHRGGNFSLVMYNLERLIGFPRVVIRWLRHYGNEHQLKMVTDFCEERGFGLDAFHANCEVEDLIDGFTHPMLKTPEQYNSRRRGGCKPKRQIPIGVDGKYLLCCASHNIPIGLTVWDNVTPEEIYAAKSKIPLCIQCEERQLWRMF